MASSIRSQSETFSQSHLLRHFAPVNRHLFPFQVRVLEYDEPVTVLDLHQVEAGSQLVLHGWTRQPKILAVCGQHRYAIPLSYQGIFRIVVRTFKGLRGLNYSLQMKKKLRVVEANPNFEDGILPVREGDVIQAFGERVGQGQGKEYIGCEKIDGQTGQTTQVFLSTSSDDELTFEEVVEDLPEPGEGPGMYSIRDFVTAVSARSFDVELVQPGPDHPDPDTDLPLNETINLRKHVIEPSVYASMGSALAPAFHIPMRAAIYVRFMRQLPRGCSPLLNKQNARISTLDRCVELLTPDVFNGIVINQKHFLQFFQSAPKGAMTLPSAAGQRGRRGMSSSQSLFDSRESLSSRKGPGSGTGSVRSFSGESISSRLKSKFGFKSRRSKSSSGSDAGSIKSLPVSSGKKSNRIQFLMSGGDRLGSGPANRSQANQKEFRFSEANNNRPRNMTSRPTNQKKGLTASANQIKTHNNTGVLQKRSTNGHLVRVMVNGDVDDDDDDDDEEEELSTNQGELRSKNPPPNNEDAGSFSQSVASSSKLTNHKADIVHTARTNQTADLKVSTNQKSIPTPSDDVAPVQRSTLSPPRTNGNGVHRHSSFSSLDGASLQSISGSISSNSTISNQQMNNGTGSILSHNAGSSAGSILKTSSTRHSYRPPLPPPQQQIQQQTTDIETKQQEMNPTSFSIPPGFALVPLNPERSAIPPGFAIVPAKDAQTTQQQQMQQQQMQQQQSEQQQLQQQQLQQQLKQQQLQQQQQQQQQQKLQQQLQQQQLQEQQLQQQLQQQIQEQQQFQQQQLQQQLQQQQQMQQQQLQLQQQQQQQKLQQPQQLPQQRLQLQQQQLNGLSSSTASLVSNERTLRSVKFDNEILESDSDALGSILDMNVYNGRLALPSDANLYSFSVKKFTEFLICLNLDETVIRACKRHRIDGKRFSRMTDEDLEQRGLLQPIVLYFRKHTSKRPNNFNA